MPPTRWKGQRHNILPYGSQQRDLCISETAHSRALLKRTCDEDISFVSVWLLAAFTHCLALSPSRRAGQAVGEASCAGQLMPRPVHLQRLGNVQATQPWPLCLQKTPVKPQVSLSCSLQPFPAMLGSRPWKSHYVSKKPFSYAFDACVASLVSRSEAEFEWRFTPSPQGDRSFSEYFASCVRRCYLKTVAPQYQLFTWFIFPTGIY